MTDCEPLKDLLALVATGIRVLPVHGLEGGACTCDRDDCPDPAKHPCCPNGAHDATADERVLRGWDRETGGRCNWAVATGPDSGIWVLDIDPRHGGDGTLARLVERHGPLPRTPSVSTGGGGTHYYFRWPVQRIPSKANVAPGLDVRGAGGYAICPPSVHASGTRYRWEVSPDEPVADAPAWLVALAVGDRFAVAGATALAPTLTTTGGTSILPAAHDWAGRVAGGLIVQPGTADLANSPGVGQGQRHQRLVQLVGVHVARGEPPERIEELALAWAGRCDPPMPDGDVLRQVRGIAAKHARSGQQRPTPDTVVEAVTDASERSMSQPPPAPAGAGPILSSFAPAPTLSPAGPMHGSFVRPQPGDWPVLHPDALYGLCGDIARAVGPETEADVVGVLLTLLAGVGNLVGKGLAFCVGPDRQHANLFLALVGDTASGKGQSFGIAKHLLRHADPGWAERCISYGLSSGEGLIERVKDPDPDGPDGCTLPPVPDKRLLALESEFGRTFTTMRREGNTLSAVLRAAWDGQPLEVLTRKGKLRAADAHVGIVAHVTPEELRKLVAKGTEVCDGFANRFLWCLVRSEKCLPHGGDIGVLAPFLDPLAGVAQWAESATVTVRRTAEADRLWEAVYPALKSSRPGPWGKATERARPQAMRLALLYAVLDRSQFITEAHLRAGLAVWDYCCESARLVFGDGTADGLNNTTPIVTGEEPLPLRVLRLIQGQPGLSRTSMHEALGNRVKAESLDGALAWLADNGMAHARSMSTGGRPAECWWPGPVEADGMGGPVPPGQGESTSVERSNFLEPAAPVGEESADERTTGSSLANAPATQRECRESRAIGPHIGSVAHAGPSNRTMGRDAEPGPEFVRSLADAEAPRNATGTGGITPPMPLPELIATVTAIGGRFVHRDGVVVVESSASIPEIVLTAVAAHQRDLRVVIPQPRTLPSRTEPSPEWRAAYEKVQAEHEAKRQRQLIEEPEMSEAEFVAALNGARSS